MFLKKKIIIPNENSWAVSGTPIGRPVQVRRGGQPTAGYSKEAFRPPEDTDRPQQAPPGPSLEGIIAPHEHVVEYTCDIRGVLEH